MEKEKISFEAKLEFKGTLEEFKEIQNVLGTLVRKGLKVGTVSLPADKAGGLMIDTVPLPDYEDGGLMIGTWPTPERKGSTVMIDTVPLPERPRLAGIPVLAKILNKDIIEKLIVDMPRLKRIEGINGGMRTAHLHIGDEIIFLNADRFRLLVSDVATQLGKDLRDL